MKSQYIGKKKVWNFTLLNLHILLFLYEHHMHTLYAPKKIKEQKDKKNTITIHTFAVGTRVRCSDGCCFRHRELEPQLHEDGAAASSEQLKKIRELRDMQTRDLFLL